MTARVGTAGWSIPRAVADTFPSAGSGLARYAGVFDAVEINSSFYRSHAPKIWERWAGSVGDGFRFAVKFPREATHERRLVECQDVVARFLDESAALGGKRGPALVQLPPSLAFDRAVAEAFFRTLRGRHAGGIAVEPRHASWFEDEADALLVAHDIARVAADPPRHPAADRPGGARSLSYWRLHGSPAMYRTPYGERCRAIAAALAAAPGEAWCVFDNTMTGAATSDALTVKALLAEATRPVATPSHR